MNPTLPPPPPPPPPPAFHLRPFPLPSFLRGQTALHLKEFQQAAKLLHHLRMSACRPNPDLAPSTFATWEVC